MIFKILNNIQDSKEGVQDLSSRRTPQYAQLYMTGSGKSHHLHTRIHKYLEIHNLVNEYLKNAWSCLRTCISLPLYS